MTSSLHILRHSPWRHPYPRAIGPHDGVCLMDDAVVAACQSPWQPPCATVYAMQADVIARGLETQILPSIQVIDDDTFVTLCEQYAHIVSW